MRRRTDAKFATVSQGERETEPGRIRESANPSGDLRGNAGRGSRPSKRACRPAIDVKQFAVLWDRAHTNILTTIDMFQASPQ